jgi:hypothetical protein
MKCKFTENVRSLTLLLWAFGWDHAKVHKLAQNCDIEVSLHILPQLQKVRLYK